MNYKQLIVDIRQQKFKPVYLLHGEEPFFIDEITHAVEEHALSEDEKEFNQTILYGRDTDVDQIIEAAKRFPMMAERQVVIVREAQNLRQLDKLESYALNPTSSTVLVIAHKYKKVDGRKKFAKNIAKSGVIFESKIVYDNQIPDWIQNYLKSSDYQITPKASILMGEFLGNNLGKIANELDKLKLNIEPGSTIDENDIEKNVGISKDFNNFELQKAIGAKDVFKATQIARYFSQNTKDHPFVMTLSILSSYFSKVMCIFFEKNKDKRHLAAKLKVNPFFVDDYLIAAKNYSGKKVQENISLIREYDARYKGVNAGNIPEGELIKEFVHRLMH
ncbi:MAG: DNA polymerase III subunit delta [Salibacter sp.]|uniref:DNA polymerase III subunit delta n=1 Tax=Salibacter sp. TaxID=2010995 RepID=UPI00286FEAE1|nr:DNA polymerase III subunit delta [Salibacter sp.]MDR9397966.1 DNA polymerase III subunit delta [Salibacter sp.]